MFGSEVGSILTTLSFPQSDETLSESLIPARIYGTRSSCWHAGRQHAPREYMVSCHMNTWSCAGAPHE